MDFEVGDIVRYKEEGCHYIGVVIPRDIFNPYRIRMWDREHCVFRYDTMPDMMQQWEMV